MINLFPISINVFAAKTDNQNVKKEESMILNLEHAEFEKGYAPVAYFHNESDRHQISEKGRTGHLSIYVCIHIIYPQTNNTCYISYFSVPKLGNVFRTLTVFSSSQEILTAKLIKSTARI